jgi:hypothetical protein
VFISANYPIGGEPLLTDDHWYVVEHMLKFLVVFYLSTISLSCVYYPTSPLMMHAIIEMLSLIKDWEQCNTRQQHNMEDNELEEKMVNLYLDGHGLE